MFELIIAAIVYVTLSIAINKDENDRNRRWRNPMRSIGMHITQTKLTARSLRLYQRLLAFTNTLFSFSPNIPHPLYLAP